jgi:hypothetical protein
MRQNRKFNFNDQVKDNMFWTLSSGVAQLTGFQVVIMWLMAPIQNSEPAVGKPSFAAKFVPMLSACKPILPPVTYGSAACQKARHAMKMQFLPIKTLGSSS